MVVDALTFVVMNKGVGDYENTQWVTQIAERGIVDRFHFQFPKIILGKIFEWRF